MFTVASSAWILLAGAPLPDGAALLARVDHYRHPWPAYSVEVLLDDGKQPQRWRVQLRENGDVRLEGVSPKEQGRHLWMLGDRLWMKLPGSRRILPVPPQQRLLGPATGGDLARIRLAEAYVVEAVTPGEWEGQPALRLDLRAQRAALTWRKAQLWVRHDGCPLEGTFYVPSGAVARTVRFEAPVHLHGTVLIPGMTLRDPSGAETRIRFERWVPGPQDPERFELPRDLVGPTTAP